MSATHKNRIRRRVNSVTMMVCLSLFTGMLLIDPGVTYSAESNSAAKANPQSATKPGKNDQIYLNFSDADITQVIEAVSKFTGQNFIIDPRVKGKVTIISQRAMNADQVYQVFLSVLKVHGFAAIPGPDVVKIVPDVNAKQDAIDTLDGAIGDTGDALITQIIEVKHVDANQLVPILRPLVPQRGHLAAVPSSNVIIIADTASNIARLTEIIKRIDTVTSDDIEVIALHHASASEVTRIIAKLDSADPKAAASKPKLVADDRTNSILLSGDKTTRLRLRALIANLDTPLDVGGNIHVVYLRNAVAKDIVPVLTGVSQSASKGTQAAGAASASNVSIQADEHTNSLVITAPSEVYRSLKSVIAQLDVRRAQVSVDSIIAEITSDKSQQLGVQWAILGNSAVGLVNFNLGTRITDYIDLKTPPSPNGFNVGFGNFTGDNKFAAILSMLSGDADTNILSTPSLVTLDNQEAEIVVGQNVPFETGSYANTGGGSTPVNPFTTIQRQDVGLTLKIKPQINEGDSIKMDVTQEVSSIAPSAAAVDLITNKRSIKTSVVVEDGQIIVLGGLIQDNLIQNKQKVPGLGDIPLLGWLFRYQTSEKIKTNLMVFLHPTILKDRQTTQAITSEKYNYMRTMQLDMKQKGLALMPDKETPVMKEMAEFLTLPPPYEDSAQRMELNKPAGDLKAPPATTSAPALSSQVTKPETPTTPPLSAPPANGSSQQFEPPFIGDDDAGKPPQ